MVDVLRALHVTLVVSLLLVVLTLDVALVIGVLRVLLTLDVARLVLDLGVGPDCGAAPPGVSVPVGIGTSSVSVSDVAPPGAVGPPVAPVVVTTVGDEAGRPCAATATPTPTAAAVIAPPTANATLRWM